MIRSKRPTMAVALLSALALVGAACGGSSGKSNKTSATTGGTGNVPKGGTLVLGAEQEPDCADWIDQCAGASWGVYTIEEHTMPRVFDYVKKNGQWTEVPTILVTGMPTAKSSPQEVVTYKINPKAVWSDGQPITSHDFKYTWDQIAHGQNIYDPTGYTNIESVDDSDPHTAVVTFKKDQPYASWKSLFGGGLYGIMPSHLLEGKDRDALMKDGYDWSGGPWIAKWDKGQQVTLTPNPRWYGAKPKLDKVIFKFLADTAAEFQAFKGGEVKAIYPQPQVDVIDQLQGGLSGVNSFFTAQTGNSEALWMNDQKAPFDSKAVRQAIAYSVDRDAIVARLFGGIGVRKALQSFNAPIVSRFAGTDFDKYKLDLKKVDSIMTGAGYQKGSDGIWAKGGQRVSFVMQSTAGNKRRELTEQILQAQLKTAGFDLTISNTKASNLFGKILPAGDYQLSLYAQVMTSLDPTLCNLFCSEHIPTAANGMVGNNWNRVSIPELDTQLRIVDTNLSDSARVTAAKKADTIIADNVVSLPLDPLPNILLWSKKIVGPVGDNPVLGMFWNVNQWGCTGGNCG